MNGDTIREHILLLPGTHSHDWSVHLTSPFPFGNLSTSTFEDHSGDGVPEVCVVLSRSLAFREVFCGLGAGGLPRSPIVLKPLKSP